MDQIRRSLCGVVAAVKLSIWIGFDSREALSYVVARHSALRLLTQPVPVRGLVLSELQTSGVYRRPTRKDERGQLWDDLSAAPMSTEFSLSRFIVPHLAGEGLALFVDSDVLFRVNPLEIFALHCNGKAVSIVKHDHRPISGTKMSGALQTSYSRKNWSSLMLFDCDHPSVRSLTPDVVNTASGLHLHQFRWLRDDEIGELPARCNYLVGSTELPVGEEPAVVHWTEGSPYLPGYANVEYASEFWQEVRRWAR